MKRNEIIVHEHKKGVRAVKYNAKPQSHIEPPKPRNPVAKNAGAAIGGGAAGAHKDAKKASQAVRGQKHKNAEMAEGGWGRDSWDSNMPGWQRREQDAWDADKRAFKRAELQHELGHEDDPDFERNLKRQAMDRDRGPWYLKVNGKILKVKGEPKVFDWKKGANNYALAVLKNKPELQGKIFLTKKNQDDQVEATGDALGTISSVTPDGKVSIKTTTGDEIKTDQSALMPGASGTVQMKPDAAGDTLKPGAKVVSTEDTAEEDMLSPQKPGDSQSPISGDEDHDEMSKLLVLKLKRLAGL